MTTEPRYRDLMDTGARRLALAGIEGARRDARRLMQAAARLDAAGLIAAETDPAATETASTYNALIERRATGEPVSKIIGRREFFGRKFKITPDVLDPRPDTEIVVEQALALLPTAPARVLELGAGSGCIIATLIAERPTWTGLGVDVSEAALRIARHNCDELGVGERVELQKSDWFSTVSTSETFDLIISNPPYIASEEIERLDREVRDYDPRLALDGGDDGLAPYRLICREAYLRLRPNGAIVFEVGIGQAADVEKILQFSGEFAEIGKCKDLSGTERCVYGRKA